MSIGKIMKPRARTLFLAKCSATFFIPFFSTLSFGSNIRESGYVSPRQSLPITNFGGATSGSFYADINLQSNVYNTTANIEIEVDLRENRIFLISYEHFGDLTYELHRTARNKLNTRSNAYADIELELSGNQLKVTHLSSAAEGGMLRLLQSEWQNLAYPIAETAWHAQGTEFAVIQFGEKSHRRQNLDLTFQSTCYNETAQMRVTVDPAAEEFSINDYRHFGKNEWKWRDFDPNRFEIFMRGRTLMARLKNSPCGPSTRLRLLASQGAPTNRPLGDIPKTLFQETYTVPKTSTPKYFIPIRLTCIETEENGEDEIVIETKSNGNVTARIPAIGYQKMNEESEISELLFPRSKGGSMSVGPNGLTFELREDDNGTERTMATLEIPGNVPQGVYQGILEGENDARYHLSYIVSNDPKANSGTHLDSIFVTDGFINESFRPATISGGDSITELIQLLQDELNETHSRITNANFSNSDLHDKILETSQTFLVIDVAGSIIGGVVMGTAKATLASIQAAGVAAVTGSATTAAAAAGAGVSVAKIGAVTAGTAVAVAAVGASIALPLYYAGTDGILLVQVANASRHDLVIESFEMSSGRKFVGGDLNSTIPAREPNKNALAFYTFEKKWGLTGIVGKIKFKATTAMPRGLTVNFNVPYNGDNTVGVSVPPVAVPEIYTSDSRNGSVRARAAISSTDGWFPTILVCVDDDV